MLSELGAGIFPSQVILPPSVPWALMKVGGDSGHRDRRIFLGGKTLKSTNKKSSILLFK